MRTRAAMHRLHSCTSVERGWLNFYVRMHRTTPACQLVLAGATGVDIVAPKNMGSKGSSLSDSP